MLGSGLRDEEAHAAEGGNAHANVQLVTHSERQR